MESNKVIFEKMTEEGGNEYEESLFNKRVKFVLSRFADRTSMHGCGYIKTSRHRFTKILWGFLTCCAIVILVVHLYMITNQYMEWPKQTTVSLEFNNLRFPAVTVCNVNVFRKRAMPKYGSKALRAMIGAVNPEFVLRDVDNSSTKNGGEQSATNNTETGSNTRKKRSISDMYDIQWSQFDEDSTIQAMGGTNEGGSDDEWNSDRSSFSLIWDLFRYLYMQLPKEDRAASGHNITDMLLECIFNGRACYASNFTLYQTPSYGNCYTLDSNKMYVKRPGPDGGLTLVLYLQTKDFIDGITTGLGAKVIVHEPGTAPMPDDDGVFVAAATETDISLKRTAVSRLGLPWGECETGEDLKKRLGLNYTVKLCHMECFATFIWEKCKCWHYMYELIADRMKVPFNVCRTSEEKSCLLKALDIYYKKDLRCVCKNPCLDAQYTVSISSRQWPLESYAAMLREGVCKSVPEDCNGLRFTSQSLQKIKRNFLLLNIYYETLNFESIEEKPLIDPFTYLSSIGGALGLWIGLSMLSFCEVMQLTAELVMCIVAKFGNARTRK